MPTPKVNSWLGRRNFTINNWSAVAHPKMNVQVERVNGMILQGLKPRIFKRLDKFRARWVAELPSLL
jgi:hypothetical protein